MRSMKKQAGVSFMGFLLLGIMIIFCAYMAMKLVPPYMSNMKVQSALHAITEEAEMEKLTRNHMVRRLQDKFNIDYIDVVDPKDLEVSKDDGLTEIRLDYETIVDLFGNLSALIEFENVSYY